VGSLVLGMFMTLDGFTETSDGEMIGPSWSDDLQTYWAEANAHDGIVLLYGRRAFEYNASFWPAMADNVNQPEGFREFAGVMNRLPKVVVSSTLSSVGWNATVMSGPLDDVARTVKSQYEGDVVAVGGMKLATGLLASEELDELRLLYLPQIAGQGRSIFAQEIAPRRLALTSNRTMDTGAFIATYRTIT
jgi:dihydrofolate reductase